jgi:hypothetical protein
VIHCGGQLARFLAALHDPAARQHAESMVGKLTGAHLPPSRSMTCAPFPGPAIGPGVESVTAVMRHYQQITGRRLSADRVMAWHLRTAVGDVLWRSEAAIPLADQRTAPEWVDDLAARFNMFGIDPEAPPTTMHVRKHQASPSPAI